MNNATRLALVLPLFLAGACQAVYYSTMATFGVEKRDILIDRLEENAEALARTSQRLAEMASAYREATHSEGGDLVALHKAFSKAYGRAESAAGDLRGSIDDTHSVAMVTFEEWKTRTNEIQDADLRKRSTENYAVAQGGYQKLVRNIRAAEQALDPLLTRFRDHDVFMKLNLHHTTMASLRESEGELLGQVDVRRAELDKLVNDTRAYAEQFDR